MKSVGFVILFTLIMCGAAFAVPMYTYVGSYAVYDGPVWTSNPTVYSALDAAVLIYGGSTEDYAISINSSTVDSSTITFTGWYDGWGEHVGLVFEQSYKLDSGAPGYSDPLGGPARSAYVMDGLSDTDKYRNYVWKVEDNAAPVPEPSTFLLIGAGLFGLGVYGRRRMKIQG